MKITKLIPLFVCMLIFTGCTVISKQSLREVDKSITLDMVQASPKQYIGAKVLWGGTIVGAENKPTVTEVEVLESDLAYDLSPKDGTSKGRFIIQSKKYLDAKIYAANKKITVAGIVKDVEMRKIGQMEYPYPIIEPMEMKLLEPVPPSAYGDMYNMYPYGHYGPYGPFNQFYPYNWPGYPPGPYPFRYPYPFPYPTPYPFP